MEGKRKKAVYASAACKTRDWKRRKGITGIRYVKASQNRKSSGIQVSYWKTRALMRLRLVATARRKPFDDLTLNEALDVALGVLDEAVPAKQRELLEQRTTTSRRAA
jgi:hypothetical protein